MEIMYNITGPHRKELAIAVGNIIGATPVYKKAPIYAFEVGDYTIDRSGNLHGTDNPELVKAIAAQEFIVP